MAVRLRLKRMGRKNRAFYRIVASDSRAQRDGRAIERLGHYDPFVADDQKKVSLKSDRIEYWLSVGAQPTVTVANLLRTRGVKFPEKAKPKATKRKTAKKQQPRKPRAKMSLRKAKKAAGKAKKPASKQGKK